jgi:hypothetical protein
MSTLAVALNGLLTVLAAAQEAEGGARRDEAPARTPTPSEIAEAGDRFQRATEMFEENNYPGALAEFRRAHAIAPSYKLLYNIGQVCYLLRDYPCALDSFTRYLARGGSAVPARRRSDLQRDVERLRARVARLRIQTDPSGAEVAVDDVVMGRTPLAEPVLVAAGRPRVTVTLPGYAPVNKVVEVAAMETATVTIKLQSLVATPAPAPAVPVGGGLDLSARLPPSAPTTSSTLVSTRPATPRLPWLVAGVLAAAAGTAGGLTLWSSADLKKHRDQWGSPRQDLQQRSSRVKQLALLTDMLIGGAVVAAGVATVVTITRSSDGGQQVAVTRRF